jgi:peroxiredoxin
LAVFAAALPAVARQAGKDVLAVGSTAPAFTANTISGAMVSFGGGGGAGKTLVVFFFLGSDFCRAELPQLQKLYSQFKRQGLTVVAVDIAIADDEAAIKRYWKEQGYDLPVVAGGGASHAGAAPAVGSGASAARQYHVRNLPTHYLIGPKDRIVAAWVGFPLKSGPVRLRAELAKAGFR